MSDGVQGGKKLALSGTVLKWIALIAMTIDHIGYNIFPNVGILRIIGRLAYPIFAYFIAEGCFYTKHKLRYFLTVFLMGAACDAVYFIFVRDYFNCIFTTFALSIFLIFAMDSLKKNIRICETKKIVLSVLWCFAAAAAAILLGCFGDIFNKPYIVIDYGLIGILTPALIWAFKDKRLKLAALAVCLTALAVTMGGYQPYALIAIVPLMFYDGTRGKHPIKYFFYIYYPVHLVIIWGIAQLIENA